MFSVLMEEFTKDMRACQLERKRMLSRTKTNRNIIIRLEGSIGVKQKINYEFRKDILCSWLRTKVFL
jgi:hypothetical protein